VVAAVVTAGVVVASRPDRTHYIAAGDSLAVGEGATVGGQFGYAGLFDQFYKKDHRGSERYTNVAVPGENSTDFGGDQLEAVVTAIDQEDSEVDVVTLTIRANDFLPLLRAEPCVSDPAGLACQGAVAVALGGFAANYQSILTQLTVALSSDLGAGRIIVTTLYNPHDGTGSPFELPIDIVLLGFDGKIDCAASQADPRNGGLNDIAACVGAGAGATVVDLHPLFDGKAPALTHIAEGDVHPNNDGHQAIADAVIEAYSGS
jgi:lysophospholipase L1-like esterase